MSDADQEEDVDVEEDERAAARHPARLRRRKTDIGGASCPEHARISSLSSRSVEEFVACAMSDDPLSEEFARWSSEDVVSSVVAELIEGAHAAASEKELASKARAYAVRGGTMAMLQAVRCYFLEADGGESSAAAQPTWAPDDEPAPASIDSWSRGAVASRKKAPPLLLPTPATRAAWRAAGGAAGSTRRARRGGRRSPRRRRRGCRAGPAPSSSRRPRRGAAASARRRSQRRRSP